MPKRNQGRSRTIKKGRTKSGNRRKNYTLRRKEISNIDKRVKAAERVIRENRERMKTSGLGLGDSISLCCRGRTCKGKRPKSLCKRITNHAMGLGNLLTYVARSYPGYEGRGDAQLVATNTSDTHVVGKSRQGFGLGPTRSRRRKGKSPKKGGGTKRKREDDGSRLPTREEIERLNRRMRTQIFIVQTMREGAEIIEKAIETFRRNEELILDFDTIRNWPIEKFEEHQNELYQSLSATRRFIRETPPEIIQIMEAHNLPINFIRNILIPRSEEYITMFDNIIKSKEDFEGRRGGRKRKTRKKRTRKKRGRGTPKKRKRKREEKPTPVKIPRENDGTRLRPPKNTGNSSQVDVVDVTQAYENPDVFWWS